VKLGKGSFVPKELGCLQLGVLYSPLMNVPRVFPPEQGPKDLARGLNTIKKCRSMCESHPDCAHYSIQFPVGLCRMALATARPLPNMFTVSGDRNACKASIGLQNVLGKNAAAEQTAEDGIRLDKVIGKSAVGTGQQFAAVQGTNHADGAAAATLLPGALLLLALSSTALAVRLQWPGRHGNNVVPVVPEVASLLDMASVENMLRQ